MRERGTPPLSLLSLSQPIGYYSLLTFSPQYALLSWHYSLVLVYIQLWLSLSHTSISLFLNGPPFFIFTVQIPFVMPDKIAEKVVKDRIMQQRRQNRFWL